MKITRSKIPHYLNHESTINEILLALGLCNSSDIRLALGVAPASRSSQTQTYLQMLHDFEKSNEASNNDISELLVAKGRISSSDRHYVQAIQSFLRAEHEASCPAAQFRHVQELLRVSWSKLFGGRKLDEASAEVSHPPYGAVNQPTCIEP